MFTSYIITRRPHQAERVSSRIRHGRQPWPARLFEWLMFTYLSIAVSWLIVKKQGRFLHDHVAMVIVKKCHYSLPSSVYSVAYPPLRTAPLPWDYSDISPVKYLYPTCCFFLWPPRALYKLLESHYSQYRGRGTVLRWLHAWFLQGELLGFFLVSKHSTNHHVGLWSGA